MLRKFWSKDGRSAIAYPDWPILASFPTIFLFIIFALSHVGSHVNLAKFWLFSRFSSTFPALELAGKFRNIIRNLKNNYNSKVRKNMYNIELISFKSHSIFSSPLHEIVDISMSNFLIFERIENDTYPEIVNEK